jgi:hypothetical protein
MRATPIAASLIGLTILLTACTSSASQEAQRAEATANSSPQASSAPEATSEASSPPETPSPSSEPTPTATSYRDVLVDGKVTSAAICNEYDGKIRKYQAAANGRITNAKGRYSDAWEAAAYRRTHPWVKDPLAKKFNQSMQASATRALNSLSDGQAGTVTDLVQYLTDSLEACGLTKAHAKAKSAVTQSVAVGASIRTKANNKPWYPKGYDEYFLDNNVAWKWTDESCGYSSGYCWTMRIKTRNGCYGGLYAEINIKKNGLVLDYSNDTLGSLGAGQTAKMEFVHFDSGAGTLTGSLNEINCY